jgi:uncharacterized membrane protein
MSSSIWFVLLTTFLASTVEAIEMVTILVGVGATRGWRSTLLGAASGFALLGAIVAVAGAALRAVPIGPLRLVVGTLLLVFGLQWLRKGVRRVAAHGFQGVREAAQDEERWMEEGVDWTAWVLAFKGVVLEGLEVVFIVVTFGATANQMGWAVLGGVSAVMITGAVGLGIRHSVTRIPRSVLQLVVGVMLTTFGTFWSLEGMGIPWPLGDAAILGLLAFYLLSSLVYIELERRRAFGLSPGV